MFPQPTPRRSLRRQLTIATEVRRLLYVVTFASFAQAAAGAESENSELQYALSLGALYSDNIERTATDEETATVATTGLDLRARRENQRLSYRADSRLNYLNYLDADLSDQVVGRFGGSAAYALLPERLLWIVQNDFEQTRIDNLSPAAPSNRQNLNQFATGPELTLRVSQSASVQMSARYARETYQESPADTDRYGGEVRLLRQSDAQTTMGVGVSTERIETEDSSSTVGDYDLNEALALYRTITPRTGLEIAAGYGRVDSDDDSRDDPIMRIEIWRRISSFSSVRVNLSQDYSTSALRSLGGSELSDVVVFNDYALAQSDPYRVRRAGIHWLSVFPRTRIECGAETGEEDHSTGTDANRDLTGFNCSVERSLTPTAQLRLFGGWTSDDVEGATDDSGDDTLLGLGFHWNFARTLGMTVQVARFEQADATENGAWLRIFYAPNGMVQTTLGDLAPNWR